MVEPSLIKVIAPIWLDILVKQKVVKAAKDFTDGFVGAVAVQRVEAGFLVSGWINHCELYIGLGFFGFFSVKFASVLLGLPLNDVGFARNINLYSSATRGLVLIDNV